MTLSVRVPHQTLRGFLYSTVAPASWRVIQYRRSTDGAEDELTVARDQTFDDFTATVDRVQISSSFAIPDVYYKEFGIVPNVDVIAIETQPVADQSPTAAIPHGIGFRRLVDYPIAHTPPVEFLAGGVITQLLQRAPVHGLLEYSQGSTAGTRIASFGYSVGIPDAVHLSVEFHGDSQTITTHDGQVFVPSQLAVSTTHHASKSYRQLRVGFW